MVQLKSRESLAVKYRPKRLEHFIGQDEIVSLLQGQFRSSTGINRSFLISGPTGCGKCITEDSLVLTSTGFQYIKDLFKKEDKEGFTEREISVCNRDGTYEKTSHVFYEKTKESYEITTGLGSTIEGTPEHKLLCLSNMEPTWKRLDEITDSDYIAIQRGMNLWPTQDVDLTSFCCPDFSHSLFSCVDCLKSCKADKVCNDFDPINTVTCRICGHEFGNLSTHIKTHRLTTGQYTELFNSSLCAPSQLYKQSKDKLGDCTFPKVMSEDLASILGYIVSEAMVGDKVIRFYNKDPWVIKDFKTKYFNVFGLELDENYDENGVCLLEIVGLRNIWFFNWLGINSGHSRVRTIPSSILKAPKHIVVAFLRAYFEGDGGWDGPRISASSASKQLISEIQIVLLNFGIVSLKRSKTIDGIRYWVLSIYSADVDLFMNDIGFLSDSKNNNYKPSDRNTNLDVIPHIGTFLETLKRQYRIGQNGLYLINGEKIKIAFNSYSNTNRPNWSYPHIAKYLDSDEGKNLLKYFPKEYKKIQDLFNLNYFWAKVTGIKFSNENKYVYDVSLPETHSFFANGFINHNTSLARVIAHYINCEQFDSKTCAPCGTCSYCKDVAQGYYGGVDEINFSDTRGIDTVRAVIDCTAYASQYNAHVFICDEIQCLTGVAQNAFLKILEEPPEGVLFLLLTTDPHRLLPTIINRCCPLTVSRVDVDEIAKYLFRISQKEKRNYFIPDPLPEDKEEAKAAYEKSYAIFKNIAKFSNGLVRQALATLEAVLSMVEGGQKIDTQDVEAIRNIVGQFIENPETELDIAKFLIQGVYSGRYGITLSYALKLLQRPSSMKITMEKTLDTHLQVLYFLVDPNKKVVGLTDPFYNRIYSSVLETVKQRGGLQLTHPAAAEMVGVFMNLIAELGDHLQDERRLLISHTLKMLEIVHKHRGLAYTRSSLFHRIHASELLQ